MKKLTALFAAAIMLLCLAVPAFAETSSIAHVFETQSTSCTHPSYELAGETWTETTSISSASHRIAVMQHGYCTQCHKKRITVIVSSKIESHNWVVYDDKHISDGEHIYFEKCRVCDAKTQYSRACGGLHMLCIGDVLK